MEVIVGPIVVIVALAVVVGSVMFQNRKIESMLRGVAARHGGEYFEEISMFFSNESYATVPFEGGVIKVDIRPAQSKNDEPHTRLTAQVDCFRTLQSYVATPLLSSLGSMLGGQDIVIGYRDYDDAFVIKSSDPAWARRVFALHDRVRRWHLRIPGRAITVQHGQLEMLQKSILTDPHEIDDFVEFAKMFAVWIPKVPEPAQLGAEYEGALSLARDEGTAGGLSVARAGQGSLNSPE